MTMHSGELENNSIHIFFCNAQMNDVNVNMKKGLTDRPSEIIWTK